ncbi:TniQ family protein [Rhodobacter capsulatus]|uniref:TniQ family protein n=1 Tax=Rhodobacter capsulatus TaxID=1061 RepID=UPI004026FA68
MSQHRRRQTALYEGSGHLEQIAISRNALKAVKETTVRGCPICLRQDSESADGPAPEAMALRGHWMLRPATICLHHRHPLVPLRGECPGIA